MSLREIYKHTNLPFYLNRSASKSRYFLLSLYAPSSVNVNLNTFVFLNYLKGHVGTIYVENDLN